MTQDQKQQLDEHKKKYLNKLATLVLQKRQIDKQIELLESQLDAYEIACRTLEKDIED